MIIKEGWLNVFTHPGTPGLSVVAYVMPPEAAYADIQITAHNGSAFNGYVIYVNNQPVTAAPGENGKLRGPSTSRTFRVPAGATVILNYPEGAAATSMPFGVHGVVYQQVSGSNYRYQHVGIQANGSNNTGVVGMYLCPNDINFATVKVLTTRYSNSANQHNVWIERAGGNNRFMVDKGIRSKGWVDDVPFLPPTYILAPGDWIYAQIANSSSSVPASYNAAIDLEIHETLKLTV